MPTHVWLLHPGGPSPEQPKKEHLKEQLLDPLVLTSIPGFLKPIWIWFLLYFRMKTPLISGPCSSFAEAEKHAQELVRLLGPDFVCHTIHRYGSDSMNVALHRTPSKSPVILFPLIPHRCSTLYSILEQSRTALRAKKNHIVEVGSYATDPQFTESVASLIRRAIIRLDGAREYAILFVLQRQPENWKSPPKEYYNDAHKSYQKIMHILGRHQPHALHYPNTKELNQELRGWHQTGCRALITVPLSWICHAQSLEEQVQSQLHQYASEIGFTTIESSSPTMYSPVFYQFLVDKILSLQEELEA
ncbi:MAG: ferrochelatase [Myxococcota bacterium]|nr:ferrochelatase [Myxococcota bacterium]